MRSASLALVVLLGAAAAAAEPPYHTTDYDDEDDGRGFSWAKAINPHRSRFGQLVARATELQQTGAFAHAVTLLREAVALAPEEPYGHYRLGIALRDLRRFGECADALLAVARLRPDYAPPDAPFQRSVERSAAECLLYSGRFEEAVDVYRRSLGREDLQAAPDIHWAMGQGYQALGRLDEAIDEQSAAVSLRPNEPVYRFSLAVALDRDEQVTRARDEMGQGVRLNRGLDRLADRSVVAVLGDDVHYYYGLAHQVIADGEPLHRGIAIAYFRKYVEVTAEGPWRKRARDHLAELGPVALGSADVDVASDVPAADRQAVVHAVLASGGEMVRCLEGSPLSALRASTVIEPPPSARRRARNEPPAAKPPAPARVFLAADRQPSVVSVGPEAAPITARQCLEGRLKALRATVTRPARVTVVVAAAK